MHGAAWCNALCGYRDDEGVLKPTHPKTSPAYCLLTPDLKSPHISGHYHVIACVVVRALAMCNAYAQSFILSSVRFCEALAVTFFAEPPFPGRPVPLPPPSGFAATVVMARTAGSNAVKVAVKALARDMTMYGNQVG